MGLFTFGKRVLCGARQSEASDLDEPQLNGHPGGSSRDRRKSGQRVVDEKPINHSMERRGTRLYMVPSNPVIHPLSATATQAQAQRQTLHSVTSFPDFDKLQQSLVSQQQQQSICLTAPAPAQADFDRLRKEILSNTWALLYLQYARPGDVDPVLVVESVLKTTHVGRGKHSAAHHFDWSNEKYEKPITVEKEQFMAVISNQGQPFIQGAPGDTHEEALEFLLQATTEVVHANRHRFFFSANHRRTVGLERSGGMIDAGSVAGAAFAREKAREGMGKAM
jgi:hypothetical protein